MGADLSGAWNSLTRLGQQLLDGVDILLSGALILDESASMTMLSLAKMVPTAISSLMGTVVVSSIPRSPSHTQKVTRKSWWTLLSRAAIGS